MQGEYLCFTLVRFALSWQTGKEEPLLGECLRNAAGTVHPRDGVQDPLPTISKNPLRLFRLHPVVRRARSPQCDGQAHLAGFQGA